jgi:hypothetical protein
VDPEKWFPGSAQVGVGDDLRELGVDTNAEDHNEIKRNGQYLAKVDKTIRRVVRSDLSEE